MTDRDDSALDALAEAFVAAARRGERPDVEAYAAAHPDLGPRIRDLFPLLLALEASPVRRAADQAEGPPPERLGPYRVVKEIGRGGMGRVYEALDPGGGRVALKTPHPHLLTRPGFRNRFLREAEAGRRLSHPGIVRTLGLWQEGQPGEEVPYLALELVEGPTLRRLLDEAGTLPERLARDVGAQVAAALAAVHAEGIVHRDVKPENVVWQPDDRVRLMDLGVALLGDAPGRLTEPGAFVGSWLYAAPEQWRLGAVDARADQYALGLVLFELVTGRHPFARAGREPVAAFPNVRPAPSVRAFAPGVSPFLEAVIRRLLSFDPDDRFASADEVARVLGEGESSAWWNENPHGVVRRRSSLQGPLRGREEALAALDAAWGAAGAGDGRLVWIEAEAGFGKTSLVEAWVACLGDEAASSVAVGVGTVDDDEEPGTWRLASALREVLGEGARLEERVLSLLGEATPWVGALVRNLRGETADELEATGLGDAYLRLLRALAAERPLVLVLEDVHATGAAERTLLRLMPRLLRGTPALVLATTRPGGADAEEAADARSTRIRLSELSPEAARELARDVLGPAATPEEVKTLALRSGGHPFFLIELARAHAAGADVELAEDVPASLRSILEARLKSLTREARRLLDAASCAGDRFDPLLIIDAVGAGRLEALEAFHDLDRRHGLLASIGAEYAFRHRLLEEAVREALPPALRTAYHAALGSTLAARTASAPPRGAMAHRLARHFLLGGLPCHAAPHLGGALDHLMASGEFRAAAALAADALAAAEPLPPETRFHALLTLGLSRLAFARAEEAVEPFEAAYAASRGGPPGPAARAAVHLGYVRRLLGDLPASLALQGEAVERAEASGDLRLLAGILGGRAVTLALAGRRVEAREAAERALALAEEAGDERTVADTARHLGEIALEMGDREVSRHALETAVRTARRQGSRLMEASALTVRAKLALLEGRTAESARILEDVRGIAGDLGHARMEAVVRANLALSHLLLGEGAEAAAQAEAAEAVARRMRYPDVLLHALSIRGRVRWFAGAWGDALADLREGVDLGGMGLPAVLTSLVYVAAAGPLAWVGDVASAEACLGKARAGLPSMNARERIRLKLGEAEVAEACADPDVAEAAFRTSLAEAASEGLRQEEAEGACRLGLLLVEQRRPSEATALLTRAHELAAACDLAGHALLAEAALAACGEGDLPAVRVRLVEGSPRVGALLKLRLGAMLAEVTDQEAERRDVAAATAALLATLRAPDAERARTAVPLLGRLLCEA